MEKSKQVIRDKWQGTDLPAFIKQLKNLKMYQKPWFLLWPGSSHVETLTARVMVLGGGIVATSSWGSQCPDQGGPRELPPRFHQVSWRLGGPFCEPERESHWTHQSCQHHDLGLPGLQNGEKETFVGHKPPSLWYSVRAPKRSRTAFRRWTVAVRTVLSERRTQEVSPRTAPVCYLQRVSKATVRERGQRRGRGPPRVEKIWLGVQGRAASLKLTGYSSPLRRPPHRESPETAGGEPPLTPLHAKALRKKPVNR